jgi:hypothetical protein
MLGQLFLGGFAHSLHAPARLANFWQRAALLAQHPSEPFAPYRNAGKLLLFAPAHARLERLSATYMCCRHRLTRRVRANVPFPMTHFVFVDFENVPGLDLTSLAGHPVKVALVLGSKSKLRADLVVQIATLPFEVRLIKVGVSRKNALDFVLTYHLGETMARHPGGNFFVISKDKKDFDPVIMHLRENHLDVSRHDDIGSLPFVVHDHKQVKMPSSNPVVVAKKLVDPRAKVIAHLKDAANRSRPTTRKRLLAYIKANWGKTATEQDAASLIQELSDSKILSIAPDNRVEYADSK